MKEERKTIDDLKGWNHDFSTVSPLTGWTYGVFSKGKFLAQVHLEDGEVSFILNRKKKIVVYKHPTTRAGERYLGMSIDDDIEDLIKEWERHKDKGV